MQETNDNLNLAAQFVGSTASHVFLTGKAGTGKTTFLRHLAKSTYKPFLIVAPTGVAALNAGGTTIHSQFLLPLGSFIPERSPAGNFSDDGNFFTQNTLVRSHPLNDQRRKVLRQIELLIIDEVSMLRPDLLDAIDFRLKSARRNFRQSFGGVQVLLIGDLYQLSPIVKDHEWRVLKNFYETPFFYSARAFAGQNFVHIELDKIFRQADGTFISILNRIRNNQCTPDDLAALNAHYRTEDEISDLEGYITLTTHNRQADEINKRKLNALRSPSVQLKATVDGQFPENNYPLEESIELKVGAQVMFVKNDGSGQGLYYNGKLAEVVRIEAPDTVEVRMRDDRSLFVLKKEQWQNKRYILNEATKDLDEEVLGTFSHYPVRLAWAVTIHKSQGLTFERAIIDAGSAFAPGQVYVALSRLTGLEGLVLRTRLHPQAISTHQDVIRFSERRPDHEQLRAILKENQRRYVYEILVRCFDFNDLMNELQQFQMGDQAQMQFEDEEIRNALPKLYEAAKTEKENLEKFKNQLNQLLHAGAHERLFERLSKGCAYYIEFLWQRLYEVILHREEVAQFSKVKAYLQMVDDIDQMLMTKLMRMDTVEGMVRGILNNEVIAKNEDQELNRKGKRLRLMDKAEAHVKAHPKSGMTKSGRRKKVSAKEKKPKKEAGETYRITFALFNDGMSIKQIAAERGLVEGTIEGHLKKGFEEGIIPLEKIFIPSELEQLQAIYRKHKGVMSKIREEMGNRFSFGLMRIIESAERMQKKNSKL